MRGRSAACGQRRRTESGSVSVHAISIAVALVLVAVTLIQVASVVRARHQAATAADLAALAASQAADTGSDGCAAAREVAQENNAEVIDCAMDAAVATITARVVTGRWWGMRWKAEQRSRAAPVSYLDGTRPEHSEDPDPVGSSPADPSPAPGS